MVSNIKLTLVSDRALFPVSTLQLFSHAVNHAGFLQEAVEWRLGRRV